MVTRVYNDVEAHSHKSPDGRIRALVDNLFIRGAVRRQELSIIRELNALATHRSELRLVLRAFNAKMMAYLADLYSHVPRQAGLSALDAAELVAATWMGLMNNSDYDDKLSDSRARRLFYRSLLSLAGLDVSSPASRRSAKAPGKIQTENRRAFRPN